MLRLLEIAMLIGGIYSIVSAKIPSFLVGGGRNQVDSRTARLFGILWTLPLPIVLISGFVLSFLFGEDAAGFAMKLEFITIFVVALLAVVFIRIVGKRTTPVMDLEETISKKAHGALMYALFSATGFAALVCCPLAIIYANQAVNLIDEHGVGRQHRGIAKKARAFAGITTFLWATATLCFASYMVAGSQ